MKTTKNSINKKREKKNKKKSEEKNEIKIKNKWVYAKNKNNKI